MLVLAACSDDDAATTSTTGSGTVAASTTIEVTTTTTPAPTPNGPPIASPGDDNEVAAAFQFLLNCAGLGPLEVDGAFGPATRAAVEAAQEAMEREVTGAADEDMLRILSRQCDDSRRVETVDGLGVSFGNAGSDDPELFFVRADQGGRLAVVAAGQGGVASIEIASLDGTVIASGSAAVAATVAPDQDQAVRVVSIGGDVTFRLFVSTRPEARPPMKAAAPGTVLVDGTEAAVSSVCVDTTGEAAFVAETAAGFLAVATGAPGEFTGTQGGIGAPVEFVYRDGSPGYVGFARDLTVEVGERVIGSAPVFLLGTQRIADEAVAISFDFLRSAVPCTGGAATSIVLENDGLGVIEFGVADDTAIAAVRQAMPGAAPSVDSGWQTVDPQDNPYGACVAGTSEVRVVEIDNLTLYFSDGPSTWKPEGGRHLVAYRATSGAFPLATASGAGPGATIGAFLDAHPHAVATVGLQGGIDVFVSSPPGSDAWLRALAPTAALPTDLDVVVGAVVGGRLCDL